MFSFVGIICMLLSLYVIFAVLVSPVLADRHLKRLILEVDASTPMRIEALVTLAKEQAVQDDA